MARILELLLHAARARASYTTRVWTALFFPLLVETLSSASTRLKIESLLVSIAIVTVYSLAYFVDKRYFR